MVLDINMPLNQKQLNELNDIFKEDYGKELSQKELFEVGTTLLSYFELLAKIYSRERLKEKVYGKNKQFDSFDKPL